MATWRVTGLDWFPPIEGSVFVTLDTDDPETIALVEQSAAAKGVTLERADDLVEPADEGPDEYDAHREDG